MKTIRCISILSLVLLSAISSSCSPHKKRTNADLLIGTWQHVDDMTNYLIFEAGMRKEIADGMEAPIEDNYILTGSDCSPNNLDKAQTHIYCADGDWCWTILKLDDDELHISLVGGRGNTLKYKRIK